jgi:heterodisulfide reductase subunit B
MRYSYFPGCSLKGLGRAYEESLLPVLKHLGVELEELDDWNCCGATAYMAVDEAKACVLASRNLALAEQQGGRPVLAPCSACYMVLNKTKHYFHDYPDMRRTIDRALGAVGLSYGGDTPVVHPLEMLLTDVGLEAIKARVTHPLEGLKVACYYGCQIVRPYSTFDDQFNPTTMDRLVRALGAEPVTYPLKTKCCGGSLTGTVPEAGTRLVYILMKEARRRGADCLATVCPLCQFNLDAYHREVTSKYGLDCLPTVYFSQLMGLAFGLPPRGLGLDRLVLPFKYRPQPAGQPAKEPAPAAETTTSP